MLLSAVVSCESWREERKASVSSPASPVVSAGRLIFFFGFGFGRRRWINALTDSIFEVVLANLGFHAFDQAVTIASSPGFFEEEPFACPLAFLNELFDLFLARDRCFFLTVRSWRLGLYTVDRADAVSVVFVQFFTGVFVALALCPNLGAVTGAAVLSRWVIVRRRVPP